MDLIDWLNYNICTCILVKHSKFKYNSDNRNCYPSYILFTNYNMAKSTVKPKEKFIFASFHHISRLYPYLKRRNPSSSNTLAQDLSILYSIRLYAEVSCLAIHYFWEVRLLKNKTPKPPIAKASITGMPIESISFIRLVLSALPWRSFSAECSRRRLLILSIWCII